MRIATLLLVTGILLLIASCKKENFKEAEWIESDCPLYQLTDTIAPLDSVTRSIISDGFLNHKLFVIEDEADFLTYRKYNRYQSIDGLGMSESKLAEVDLNSYNIFVLPIYGYGQGCFEISKSKIKINEDEKEIYFDFKVDVFVGGSGMAYFGKIIYFIIPKDKADYYFHGDLDYNEKNALGGTHDKSFHYELMP